jgi:hypothetical protein
MVPQLVNNSPQLIEPVCQLPRSREPTNCPQLVPHGSSPCSPILFKNHSNTIHPSTPKLARHYLVTFPYRNPVCISVLSCARRMLHATRSRISILCIPRGLSSNVCCCGTHRLSLSQFLVCLRHTCSETCTCVTSASSAHCDNSKLGGDGDTEANINAEKRFVTSKI